MDPEGRMLREKAYIPKKDIDFISLAQKRFYICDRF